METESTNTPAQLEKSTVVFDDSTPRLFIAASVIFGIVGLLVGVIIALQLAFFPANVAPQLSFGRLRPLHTNAVIFAFVGNMIFAGIYYSTQRLLKARMASDALSKIHFWGWQAIIAAAAVSLPLGFSTGKEYAELEWPIDIAIALVWVVFAINFFWTLAKRNEKHIYVALWFYIATIVTVAVLHIVNSLALPVFAMKSYSIYGGVQDALVQWWYGHNAVAFFLTTPVLGIMYYFLPKAADRPVYSYRLSIVHFWALIFLYIWAGPHHLLFTALPDWAQTLGMIFSVMLLAPSWGGMLNGLLTLRGAWNTVREEPVLKFFVAAVTFYGMATFEGPLLSIKSVNGLAHYTDWIIGHVHSGALGWNGFMAAGLFYWMVPRLFGTKLHSKSLADTHFWLGTVGIILYVISMWVSGITQGMMWRAQTPDGALQYPNFVETLIAIRPMYWVRLAGGTLYLLGFLLMAYNLLMTARAGKAVDGEVQVVRPVASAEDKVPWTQLVFGAPMILTVLVVVLIGSAGFLNVSAAIGTVIIGLAVGIGGVIALKVSNVPGKPTWHRIIEGRPLLFTVFSVLAILVGGIAEIIPTVVISKTDARVATGGVYKPLELEGRDVYIREGCYTCHSQMIRPMVFETARYGNHSEMADSAYDHPFQWGSKRTGPDLSRVGGKYPHLWHWRHMQDPRATSPGSNMPPYAFMAAAKVDFDAVAVKVAAMQTLGVPYTNAEVQGASAAARAQAAAVTKELREGGAEDAREDSELVALVAYMQSLGRKADAKPATAPVAERR